MNYTDGQLKRALAKMLPEHLEIRQDYLVPDGDSMEQWPVVYWKDGRKPLNTELLHLCWLVEQTLDPSSDSRGSLYYYHCALATALSATCEFRWGINASWQQRTIALAKTKGIEIV